MLKVKEAGPNGGPQNEKSEGLHEAEFIERIIQRLFHDLPPKSEIVKRWQDKYDEAEDLNVFLKEFEQFMEDRKSALASSVELFPQQSEIIKKEVLYVVDCIKTTFGNMDYFLGNGYTAEVYELPLAPHLCVKYIHDQKAYNENKHMRVEYGYLKDLHNLRVDNIRTPLPAFLRIHPSEGHSYGMEKVNGKSLSQILEKIADNSDLVNLAKRLDRNKVVDSVVAFIKKMHEMGIVHNDLFMRNIMLDRDGNVFIIDFGKAEYVEIGDDRDDQKKRDLTIAKNEIMVFFKELDKLEI